VFPTARTCPTCGANNDDGSISCVECDEPIAGSPDERGNPLEGFAKFPSWARWFIALPAISIIAATIIRQLASAGFRDIPNAAMYAVAMAVAIAAAAQAAAFVAPSYRSNVGLAVAVALLAVIVKALLSFASQYVISNFLEFPAWIAVLYIVIPSMGIMFSTFLLLRNTFLIDEPMDPIAFPGGLALKWWIAISAALGLGSAFDAIAVGAGALCPACLPRSSSESLAAVIGTAITIVLIADYAPAKKMVAAWIVAGLNFLFGAISIVFWVGILIHVDIMPFLRLDPYYGILVSVEFITGAAIGLRAAAVRHAETMDEALEYTE
jgi:hypothetical protein